MIGFSVVMIIYVIMRCSAVALCLMLSRVASKFHPLGIMQKKSNDQTTLSPEDSGDDAYSKAELLFKAKVFDKASEAYWQAVLKGSTANTFKVRAMP